jgi:hypothetical protein
MKSAVPTGLTYPQHAAPKPALKRWAILTMSLRDAGDHALKSREIVPSRMSTSNTRAKFKAPF